MKRVLRTAEEMKRPSKYEFAKKLKTVNERESVKLIMNRKLARPLSDLPFMKGVIPKKKLQTKEEKRILGLEDRIKQLEEENGVIKASHINLITKFEATTEENRKLKNGNDNFEALVEALRKEIDSLTKKSVTVPDQIISSDAVASNVVLPDEIYATVHQEATGSKTNELSWWHLIDSQEYFNEVQDKLVKSLDCQEMLIASNDNINVPDEETYMRLYLARIFTREFFIDTIALNARTGKVNFKNKMLLHCFAVDSAEIQILNPWVKIPDDWNSGSYSDESSTSSESTYSMSSAQAQYYSSSYGGSDTGTEPFFDHAMMTNLSEHLGNHAFLKCRVKKLGDGTVSWVRRRDWHILASGRNVYIADDRFKIDHVDGGDEWTLVIKYVQTRDQGMYECQVSSVKGIISHLFNLNVLVPQAHILGAKEYHVQRGTVISLVCIIENSPRQSSQYLYWYHNSQMVNYGAGISIHTEPGIHTHSRLIIPSAGPQHTGNFTCKAANTKPSTVQVYVSDGDKPAAIQGQTGAQIVTPKIHHLLAAVFLPTFLSIVYFVSPFIHPTQL